MARALVHAALAIVCVAGLGGTGTGLMWAADAPGPGVGSGSVAAGRAHTLAATPDGRVYAWGAGSRGQIGDGTLVDRWTPTLVAGLDDVVSVAAGAAHSIALTKSGEVYAWGANASGRLGDGTKKRRTRPVRVQGLPKVKAVAAGRAHSLALTENGRVFAWGRNASGQLGNGRKTPSLVPVQVTGVGDYGLSDVVAIAAGDAHSLAVTGDGHVWAWGSNESSMLGDGTSKDRSRPVAIALTGVAAVAAGEAHSLALLRSGEVYSWGRGANGALGTGSTRVSATPKRIAGLHAAAIAAGRHFSAALRPDGRLVAWGANGSGQLGDQTTTRRLQPVPVVGLDTVTTVALGDVHAVAVTAAGVLRAWGDGASGRLGNGGLADQTAPAAVDPESLDWDGEDEEPPAPPTIAPSSGIYPAAPLVTLSAGGNTDLIRFTLDGSVPDETSPEYTAPLVVPTSTTVTARSFSPSGLSSSSRAETYTIDTIPPAITVSTSPPLPVAGWITSPVTVAFHCVDNLGLASCSEPVLVTEDGLREITGTAVDAAGHRATASVIVPLDLDPPLLSITAPADQTPIAADRLEVFGVASDAASGLVDARCNGGPASVVEGVVRCEVSLHPGRNEIILHARDAAGHNSSAAISVQRVGAMSALTLSPATRSMEVSEVARLSLRDDHGSPVEAAVWTSSEDGVVELSQADPPELLAVGIGTATITAEKDGFSATATIRVSAALTAGAVRWTIPPLEGFDSEQPIFTNRTDASVPAMFTVDTQDWGEATLRAVTAEGEVLWQQHSPGVPLMGDSFGGVLAGVFNEDEDFGAFVRLGGGSIRPWRFESAGGFGRPAQALDGTLYAIEYLPTGMNSDLDKYAVVIDGATGRLISRTLLAREVDEFVSDRHGDIIPGLPPIHCLTTHIEYAPHAIGPIVGGDGRGYLVVRRHSQLKRGGCIPPFMLRPDRTIDMTLDLVVLSRNEPPRTVTLYSAQCIVPVATTFPCDLPVRAQQVMPDGVGGVLVTFERGTHMVGSNVNVQRSLTRLDADGTLTDRPVGPQYWLEVVGQAGTALEFDEGWKVTDVATGDVKWANLSPVLAPLAIRPDGGLAALDMSTNELKITDATGNVERAQPFGLDWFAVHQFGGWIGHRGSELASVVGDFADAGRFSALRGNAQGQLAVSRPGIGMWLKTHSAFEPLDTYQHASLRVTPINQRWLLDNAQRFEACVPQENCVPLGVDDFGNRFFTIGAGTGNTDTALRCDGVLTKGLNRPSDVRTPPAAPLIELPIDSFVQGIVINSLLERFDAYQNTLPYYCFPEERPGSYNSNSFAHGLLHAAGVGHREAPPTRQSIPGWFTPVPSTFFER